MSNLKTIPLKKRFYAFTRSLDPPFGKNWADRIFCSVKRSQAPGQWQSIDLQFWPEEKRIFLNLGLSPAEELVGKSSHQFVEPESYQPGQTVYFRAAVIWAKQFGIADSWFIRPKELDLNDLYELAGTTDRQELMAFVAGRNFSDGQGGITTGWRWSERIIHLPGCFFKTEEEAMDDIERCVKEYVLPYFDRMAERQLEYNAGQSQGHPAGPEA